MATATNELYGFETYAQDRRRTPERKFEIKQLWQRSHEILNLALLGHSNKTISQLLGVTPATVSNALNSTVGKKKLSTLRKTRDDEALELSKEITDLTELAIKTYKMLFEAPVENTGYELKKSLADTVMMDIAGHRAATKVDNRSINFHLTSSEIDEFKERGLKQLNQNPEVIDV